MPSFDSESPVGTHRSSPKNTSTSLQTTSAPPRRRAPRRRAGRVRPPAPRRGGSRCPPRIAVALGEQVVSFLRSPAAGPVRGQRDGAGVERVDERLHDPPRLIHLVTADEEGRVAEKGVAEDALVCLGRLFGECVPVPEVERHAAYPE